MAVNVSVSPLSCCVCTEATKSDPVSGLSVQTVASVVLAVTAEAGEDLQSNWSSSHLCTGVLPRHTVPLHFAPPRGILIKYYQGNTFQGAQRNWGGKAMLLREGLWRPSKDGPVRPAEPGLGWRGSLQPANSN